MAGGPASSLLNNWAGHALRLPRVHSHPRLGTWALAAHPHRAAARLLPHSPVFHLSEANGEKIRNPKKLQSIKQAS